MHPSLNPAPLRSFGTAGVLVLLAGCFQTVPPGSTLDSVDLNLPDDTSGNGGGNGGNGNPDIDGELSNLSYGNNAVIPNVVHVEWDTNLPGVSHVEYGLDGALDHSTPVSADGTHFDFNLLGLKSNHSYSFQAVTVTDDGQTLKSDLGTVDIPIQPQGLPSMVVSEYDPARTMDGGDGFVLLSIVQTDNSWVAIVDRDGDYVWYVEADDGLNIPSAHPSPDGTAIVYTQNDRMQVSDFGGIVRMTMDGDKVVTFAPGGHHDAIQLNNGDIAFLNVETDTWDVDNRGDALVAFDNVYEAPLGAEEGDPDYTRVWSLSERLSDYPYEPWHVCSHFDAEAYHMEGTKDWSHSNSIMTTGDDDYIYFVSKNLDAMFKVERETNREVWQLGGRDSDFTFSNFSGAFEDSPDVWSHGHMSHLWDGGFCMFDNGYHHDTDATGEGIQHSRAIEYSFDESTRKVTKTWDWWVPDNYFNPELGDCRRLGNENHLVSVMVAGYAVELSPENDVIWKLAISESGAALSRVTYLHDIYTLAQE